MTPIKMENIATTSNQSPENLNLKDIERMADMIIEMQEKPLPSGLSFFTRIMNRLGWHRKYEIIVVDKDRLRPYWKIITHNIK